MLIAVKVCYCSFIGFDKPCALSHVHQKFCIPLANPKEEKFWLSSTFSDGKQLQKGACRAMRGALYRTCPRKGRKEWLKIEIEVLM